MLKLDDRRFNLLAVGAVIFGFVLLLSAFGAGILTLIGAQRSNERVDHTYRVINELAEVDVWVERAETASRGYLLAPDPERAETFRTNVAKIGPSVDRLTVLTGDNQVQRRNVAILRTRLAEEVASLEAIMQEATTGKLDEARALFVNEVKQRRVNGIRATTAEMRAEEERLFALRIEAERSAAATSQSVLAITGLLLIALAIGAIWLVRRYTVDLASARNRLHLLNTDLEGAVTERTSDLRRANDELQRFTYIVSHDLRSPLVNVMGFTAELEAATGRLAAMIDRLEAEAPALVKQDERTAAQEDLPEAISFIRSSTQKMDRLINAILKLSREGRRNLMPERLPMDRLVRSIRDTLEHPLQETGATITIDGTLPDLVSDRVAIEQLFSNLIENAVKYQRPDKPGRIVVRGADKGGRAIYQIQDNGRGIDPRDHQRIFDLFRRSGHQDQPGEGIGLAHVRALAYRLGGTIDVASALGKGTTFTLDLPVTYSDEGFAL